MIFCDYMSFSVFSKYSGGKDSHHFTSAARVLQVVPPSQHLSVQSQGTSTSKQYEILASSFFCCDMYWYVVIYYYVTYSAVIQVDAKCGQQTDVKSQLDSSQIAAINSRWLLSPITLIQLYGLAAAYGITPKMSRTWPIPSPTSMIHASTQPEYVGDPSAVVIESTNWPFVEPSGEHTDQQCRDAAERYETQRCMSHQSEPCWNFRSCLMINWWTCLISFCLLQGHFRLRVQNQKKFHIPSCSHEGIDRAMIYGWVLLVVSSEQPGFVRTLWHGKSSPLHVGIFLTIHLPSAWNSGRNLRHLAQHSSGSNYTITATLACTIYSC